MKTAKTLKLNHCLLSMLALFCIGAAHGVTVRCEPVTITGFTRTAEGGIKKGSDYSIYIKFEYTEGNASKTTSLKIIRKRLANQVIQKFDASNLNVEVKDASPSSIEGNKEGDSIIMTKKSGNTWSVFTSFTFDRATKSSTVYGSYEGDMTCTGGEEGKDGEE